MSTNLDSICLWNKLGQFQPLDDAQRANLDPLSAELYSDVAACAERAEAAEKHAADVTAALHAAVRERRDIDGRLARSKPTTFMDSWRAMKEAGGDN